MSSERELKEKVKGEVEARRGELMELSLRLHQNPELALRETKASSWLTEYLEKNGFGVERGICQLPTAFRASYGSGKPAIAFLAEYDALPELGHACGHNIIATSSVGAGIAARIAVDQLGGRVVVMGTPAEELHGGKITMVERGGFEGIDAAMLVHPGGHDRAVARALACAMLEAEFFGRAAHAAAHPEQGINALEAIIQSFNGINSLRQHIKPTSRIHGIITDGGEAANIVPAHSSGIFLVRAEDEAYLEELKERVLSCFRAASASTGAELKYNWGKTIYSSLKNNMTLAHIFAKNMESLGRKISPPEPGEGFGSTDMGNVSQVLPAIHPSVAIVPQGVSEHTLEFAAAAASEAGNQGMLDAAAALAMTAVDLLAQPQTLAEVKREFETT
jgi:amidohydrolase